MSNFHNLREIKFNDSHVAKTIVLDRMVWFLDYDVLEESTSSGC